MVRDSEAIVRLTRLVSELDVDRAALAARAAETRELVGRPELARPELVLLAVNVHGWYTALEAAMERVARLLDQTVPSGPSWHSELISQMLLEVPGLRPALVPSEVVAQVHELRRFRHFFRNAYFVELDPARVRRRAEELLLVHGVVANALTRLCALLGASIETLGR